MKICKSSGKSYNLFKVFKLLFDLQFKFLNLIKNN